VARLETGMSLDHRHRSSHCGSQDVKSLDAGLAKVMSRWASPW